MTDITKYFNFDLGIQRILLDTRSDFVFIPQFSNIYRFAPEALKQLTKRTISRSYSPQSPIILEVAKPNGLTRPGASLYPVDRLIYQCLADYLFETIENLTDRSIVISYQANREKEKTEMFIPPSKCHKHLRDKLKSFASQNKYKYALRSDIHSYFENINLHDFPSLLNGSSDKTISNFLHEFLKGLRTRNSRGLLQGIQPSDLLGNFYLVAFDHQINSQGIKYLRYVDDIYLFFKTKDEALHFRAILPSLLRGFHLTVNETKTNVIETSSLYEEETDIDRIFSEAKNEMEEALEHQEVDFYGTEILAEEPDQFNEDFTLDLSATKSLIDLIPSFPRKIDKIFNFALPKLALAKDDYALSTVLSSFSNKPHLAKTFVNYLAHLSKVIDFSKEFVEKTIQHRLFYPSQVMWYFMLLRYLKIKDPRTIKLAAEIYQDRNNSPAVRGIISLYLTRCGGPNERRRIRNSYDSETDLVKTYILYATSEYPEAEKRALQNSWKGQSDINHLIIQAMKNKATSQ